jgi:hypothetical protein
VWLPGLKTDANGHNCSVTRVDATTLAELATIATPCSAFGDVDLMASDGEALWFVDNSKYDSTTGKGAVITRIDPATNAPGTSVPLPVVGGYAYDSQGAFFYAGSDQTYYRLVTGSTAFDSLGIFKTVPRPVGTGLWSQDNTNKTASYYTQAGTPQASVQIKGSLAGGDASAAYTEVSGTNDSASAFEDQLWRYPIDGSAPTKIAVAPTIDGNSFGYTDDPQPISNGDGFLKIWTTRIGNQQLWSILLQWTPVR